MSGVDGIGQEPVGDGVQRRVVPLSQLGERFHVAGGDPLYQVTIGGLSARLTLKGHPALKRR